MTEDQEKSKLYKDIEIEFDRIGIDMSSAKGRQEFRETLAWAHLMRRRCQKVSLYVVFIVVGGVLTTLGAYMKTIITMLATIGKG